MVHNVMMLFKPVTLAFGFWAVIYCIIAVIFVILVLVIVVGIVNTAKRNREARIKYAPHDSNADGDAAQNPHTDGENRCGENRCGENPDSKNKEE